MTKDKNDMEGILSLKGGYAKRVGEPLSLREEDTLISTLEFIEGENADIEININETAKKLAELESWLKAA